MNDIPEKFDNDAKPSNEVILDSSTVLTESTPEEDKLVEDLARAFVYIAKTLIEGG